VNTKHRSARLSAKNYLGVAAYFVTICCHNRQPIFRDLALGKSVLATLISSSARHDFRLIAFCAMPDHLHFLAHGNSPACNLIRFVSSFKQQTGYSYQRQTGQRLWQPRYYEHILRSSDDFAPIAFYIWNNPVRKALCMRPADYSLSGSTTTDLASYCSSSLAWTPPWQNKNAGLKPGTTVS